MMSICPSPFQSTATDRYPADALEASTALLVAESFPVPSL
jgi:hypothetical protein